MSTQHFDSSVRSADVHATPSPPVWGRRNSAGCEAAAMQCGFVSRPPHRSRGGGCSTASDAQRGGRSPGRQYRAISASSGGPDGAADDRS